MPLEFMANPRQGVPGMSLAAGPVAYVASGARRGNPRCTDVGAPEPTWKPMARHWGRRWRRRHRGHMLRSPSAEARSGPHVAPAAPGLCGRGHAPHPLLRPRLHASQRFVRLPRSVFPTRLLRRRCLARLLRAPRSARRCHVHRARRGPRTQRRRVPTGAETACAKLPVRQGETRAVRGGQRSGPGPGRGAAHAPITLMSPST